MGRLARHESTAIVSVTTPGFDSDCVCPPWIFAATWGCRDRTLAYTAERTLRHWPTGGSRTSASSAVLVVQAAEGSVHAVRRGRRGERLAGLRGEGLEQVCDQPGRGLGSRS